MYKAVKNAIKYGRDEFSVNTIVSSLQTRDLKLKLSLELRVKCKRGAPSKNSIHGNNMPKSRSSSRSKSRFSNKKC